MNYQGYPLVNYARFNFYSQVTVDECQYLCEISDLCQYFNYVYKNENYEHACFLKFGVGKRITDPRLIGEGASFGHKYSSGM